MELFGALFELLLGLLLRVSFRNPVEQLVHLVAIAGRRLVKDVPPEVGSGI